MIRAEIGASSTALRSDSLYFAVDDNDLRSSFGLPQLAADGGWWSLAANSRRLQKIASDGTKVYGDSGLVISDRISGYRLLPDPEGGAWVVWGKSSDRKIRTIHFDANRDKVGDNYPDRGLDIFDNGVMDLIDAAFDPNT